MGICVYVCDSVKGLVISRESRLNACSMALTHSVCSSQISRSPASYCPHSEAPD